MISGRLPAALAVAVIVGCGSGGAAAGPPATPSTHTVAVDISMTDYRFSPDRITVPAGSVRFRLINVGTTQHDFTVLTADGQHRLTPSSLVRPGQTAAITLRLGPGRYPVICSQPGHQELGMDAVILAVEA